MRVVLTIKQIYKIILVEKPYGYVTERKQVYNTQNDEGVDPSPACGDVADHQPISDCLACTYVDSNLILILNLNIFMNYTQTRIFDIRYFSFKQMYTHAEQWIIIIMKLFD